MNKSIREKHAQATKEIIIETALSLFKEKSYSEVTVDDIVKACGTSKGAFYYHFKSKDELISYEYSLSDKVYDEINETLLRNYESAAQRLFMFAYYLADNTVKVVTPDTMKVFLGSHLVNKKMGNIINNPNRSIYRIVNEIVEYGQSNGEFRKDLSSSAITNAVVRAIRGIHYDWALEEYDLVSEIKTFFEYMFLPGILSEGHDLRG